MGNGIYNSTNNIAELTALEMALQLDEDLEIIYDSKYAVDCVTKWGKNWRGKPNREKGKKNLEQIYRIMDLLKSRNRRRLKTVFTWQKGHTGELDTIEKVLNDFADRLCSKIIKGKKDVVISGINFGLKKQYERKC